MYVRLFRLSNLSHRIVPAKSSSVIRPPRSPSGAADWSEVTSLVSFLFFFDTLVYLRGRVQSSNLLVVALGKSPASALVVVRWLLPPLASPPLSRPPPRRLTDCLCGVWTECWCAHGCARRDVCQSSPAAACRATAALRDTAPTPAPSTCVGCENTRMTQGSRTHTIFWHPTHTSACRSAAVCATHVQRLRRAGV